MLKYGDKACMFEDLGLGLWLIYSSCLGGILGQSPLVVMAP